jgi:hypothetical protein
LKLELSCDEVEAGAPLASFFATIAAAVEAAKPVSIRGTDPGAAGLAAFFAAGFLDASASVALDLAAAAVGFFAAGFLDGSDFFSFAMLQILSGGGFATNSRNRWIVLAFTAVVGMMDGS